MADAVRSIEADEIVRLARAWIGTPYHHQACLAGIGADCVGLIRGVWRELYGFEAETPPPYTRDWADATGHETLIEIANRHLDAVAIECAAPGDVLIFRLRGGLVAKHAGLMATAQTMIHAVDGSAVAEVWLTPWWRRRLAAAFRFPKVQR